MKSLTTILQAHVARGQQRSNLRVLLMLLGVLASIIVLFSRAVSRAHGARRPAAQLAHRLLLDDRRDVHARFRRHHVHDGPGPDVLGARRRDRHRPDAHHPAVHVHSVLLRALARGARRRTRAAPAAVDHRLVTSCSQATVRSTTRSRSDFVFCDCRTRCIVPDLQEALNLEAAGVPVMVGTDLRERLNEPISVIVACCRRRPLTGAGPAPGRIAPSDARVRQFSDRDPTAADALRASIPGAAGNVGCCVTDGVWRDLMAVFPAGTRVELAIA